VTGPQHPADTIVATSSPAGRSPRAIIRLSGPEAVGIASAVFTSDRPLGLLPSYSSAAGFVVLPRQHIRCPATAYVMPAPRSYTREDVVELHTFGAPPLLGAIADALMAEGARPAEPGEFTRRAFLNGRIDLTQAEAVQAVIRARSETELRVAQLQLGGSFTQAIEVLRRDIVHLLAEVEASIDFVDQDIELVEPAAVAARVEQIRSEIGSLAGAEPAVPPKEGVVTAIFGPPNAGKSSLLNALIGAERAIVTRVPGTTRDTIEHVVEMDGIAFRLVDTAGVRRAAHVVEEQAISRADAAAKSADLALLVVDGARPLGDDTRKLWERLTSRRSAAVVTVINKSDLPARLSASDEGQLAQRCPIVRVSALLGDGLDDLRAAMLSAVRSDAIDRSTHPFWPGARHRAALRSASDALGRAGDALAGRLGLEFAAADLHDALTALGDVVGATTAADILDTIFSRFCIGK